MTFRINEEAIRQHATALNHAVETEIRVNSTPQLAPRNRKERFVHSIDKIISVVKKYNPQKNAYIANNERWIGGSTIPDVKTINAQYFDYEAIDHAKNGKNFALRLAEENRTELKKQNINLALSDSGNGIHGLISLSTPIPIEQPEEKGNLSLLQAKDYIKRIKTYAGKQKNEYAKNDKVIHNLACMEKIVGSYSHSADATTFWLDNPKPTQTEDWLAWVGKMPKEEVEANDNLSLAGLKKDCLPSDCNFLNWALNHCLPRSEEIARYHYVAPNIAAFTRNLKNKAEVRLAWEKLQDSNNSYVGCLACWDKIPTQFNCTQLRHYAEKVGLGHICEECLLELI